MKRSAFLVLLTVLTAMCSLAVPADALECGKGKLGGLEAAVDKPEVPRGDSVKLSVKSCYEPPGFALWARVRESPKVALPMYFDKQTRRWNYSYVVTQEILPGMYHVDFFVKSRAGKTVFIYPRTAGVSVAVVWPEKQKEKLEEWKKQKQELIESQKRKMDRVFNKLPKFQYVGVWFDAGFYHRRRGSVADEPAPWNPYLRKNIKEEFDYIAKKIGLNSIVLYGGTAEENDTARAEFPFFVTDKPRSGDYAIYNEPDYMNKPIEEVGAWVRDMKAKGIKTIVNFSGHKPDDTWTDYVYRFLNHAVPDVVSVDCYPIFYDVDTMDFCRERFQKVAEAARSHGTKVFLILQAFAQLDRWAFPTPFYLYQMSSAAEDAVADGVIFFIWTSGADDKNFTVGLDSMPQDYHRLLHGLMPVAGGAEPGIREKGQIEIGGEDK